MYLDESIYSRVLCEALEHTRAQVKRPGVDIPFGTPDETWLTTAGAKGWIVLMRDQRVRHRALEMRALATARVGAFVLTAGQATASETAAIVIPKVEKLVNISESERRPFLYTLGIGGTLSRLKVK